MGEDRRRYRRKTDKVSYQAIPFILAMLGGAGGGYGATEIKAATAPSGLADLHKAVERIETRISRMDERQRDIATTLARLEERYEFLRESR